MPRASRHDAMRDRWIAALKEVVARPTNGA
jgi:hypothetical protein